MNNCQAPETSPHPPQPTNHWLSSSPNVFTVHTFTLLWTESSCCSVVCPKIWREIVLESCIPGGLLNYNVWELCWHILLPLSFAETWKCELNYSCGRQILCFHFHRAPQVQVCLSPNNSFIRTLLCCVMGLCVTCWWQHCRLSSGVWSTNRIAKDALNNIAVFGDNAETRTVGVRIEQYCL